jgi:hypothetical protein
MFVNRTRRWDFCVSGKPDALSNCTILNQTAESLHVECTEGFDGGLQQEFIMEVYDTQTRKLVSNVTSKNPIFTVGGLESGLGFDVGLYASNKKGRSDVSHLHAFTLKSAEKHTGKLDSPHSHLNNFEKLSQTCRRRQSRTRVCCDCDVFISLFRCL